jgi:hypothetical protein
MSKKGKQMDLYFQIWNMKRYLRYSCIEPDTIDISGLLDSTLFYPENEVNIRKILHISSHHNNIH